MDCLLISTYCTHEIPPTPEVSVAIFVLEICILLEYHYDIVILVVFFFLSRFLAKKIVAPLEESYQKQKQFISDANEVITMYKTINDSVCRN